MKVVNQSIKVQSLNKVSRGDKRATVLAFLHANPGSTRREIAEGTDMLLSSVCGRVNELMELGQLCIAGLKFDKQTNRNVQTLKAV
jgi:hypothetical protein